MITAMLQDAGYRHIGMDHYVLPTDDLAVAQGEGRLQRNFQGYSLQMADDLLGLGVSAISQIGDFYLQNARDLDTYYRLLDSGLLPLTRGCMASQEDKLRRHIIMSLICELALDIGECNRQFGIDFHADFADELLQLEDLAADGLLTISAEAITVHPAGRPFLRNICMPFDAYLEQQQEAGNRRFSATV
jgi:oxygen-independent coproporphyrinogen-3 oxidase